MKLTESEWQIMNSLWKYHPATARELGEHLPEEIHWAYTTIKTLLARLVAKKTVSERKRGNTSVYAPLISKKKAQRSAVGRLADQAFDGAVEPLLHFIVRDKLSGKQRRELIEILEQEDSNRKGGKR